jgi:hypothetical protein
VLDGLFISYSKQVYVCGFYKYLLFQKCYIFFCLIDRKYLLIGNDKKILDVFVSLLETLFMDNKSRTVLILLQFLSTSFTPSTWCFFFMQFVGLGTSKIKDDVKIIVLWDVTLCSLVAKN